SSRWQSLRYKVMRVGGGPETPVILLNTEHGVLLGDEPPFRLRVTDHGFALTFRHEQSLDYGIMERSYILQYSVRGDEVTRITPFALQPEDFLDEWVHMPWAEASRWVAPSRRDELQSWHEKFSGKSSGTNETYGDTEHSRITELTAVHRCPA